MAKKSTVQNKVNDSEFVSSACVKITVFSCLGLCQQNLSKNSLQDKFSQTYKLLKMLNMNAVSNHNVTLHISALDALKIVPFDMCLFEFFANT